jgi:SAM-dependent methyltransferase
VSVGAKLTAAARRLAYRGLDRLFRPLDLGFLHQTPNLALLPDAANRYGGQIGLAEWSHTVGLFQALMFARLDGRPAPGILDVGCGTGKLAVAADALLGPDGRYVGIDIQAEAIEFCRRQYPAPRFEFHHLPARNPFYVEQAATRPGWPVADASVDLVTAVSVWTHFQPEDAVFYFGEVERALRAGGTALLTFFLLDETYQQNLERLSGSRFAFDAACAGSPEWRHPGWASVPEAQIGVTPAGIHRLLEAAGRLVWLDTTPGRWKDGRGLFLQDVLAFRKRQA